MNKLIDKHTKQNVDKTHNSAHQRTGWSLLAEGLISGLQAGSHPHVTMAILLQPTIFPATKHWWDAPLLKANIVVQLN